MNKNKFSANSESSLPAEASLDTINTYGHAIGMEIDPRDPLYAYYWGNINRAYMGFRTASHREEPKKYLPIATNGEIIQFALKENSFWPITEEEAIKLEAVGSITHREFGHAVDMIDDEKQKPFSKQGWGIGAQVERSEVILGGPSGYMHAKEAYSVNVALCDGKKFISILASNLSVFNNDKGLSPKSGLRTPIRVVQPMDVREEPYIARTEEGTEYMQRLMSVDVISPNRLKLHKNFVDFFTAFQLLRTRLAVQPQPQRPLGWQ